MKWQVIVISGLGVLAGLYLSNMIGLEPMVAKMLPAKTA